MWSDTDDDTDSDGGWTQTKGDIDELVKSLNEDASAESETGDDSDEESPATDADVKSQRRRSGEDLEMTGIKKQRMFINSDESEKMMPPDYRESLGDYGDVRFKSRAYGIYGDGCESEKLMSREHGINSDGNGNERSMSRAYGINSDDNERSVSLAYGVNSDDNERSVSRAYGINSDGNENERLMFREQGVSSDGNEKNMSRAYGISSDECENEKPMSWEYGISDDNENERLMYRGHGNENERSMSRAHCIKSDDNENTIMSRTYGDGSENATIMSHTNDDDDANERLMSSSMPVPTRIMRLLPSETSDGNERVMFSTYPTRTPLSTESYAYDPRVQPNMRSMGSDRYITSQEIKEKDPIEQMHWAISTENIDLAKRLLQQNKDKLENRHLSGVVIKAIKTRRPDLVSLFIETGLMKKKFMTAPDIRELYKSNKEIESLLKPEIFPGIKIPLEEDGTAGLEHLFVYCLLVHDHEIAKLVWTQLDEPIASAIFAKPIYKMVNRNRKGNELSEKLRQNGQEFTNLAIKVIDSLHREGRSRESLIRKLTRWEDKSCLTAAAGNKKFLSSVACQELLENIWWGSVSVSNVLFVIMLCTILLPRVIYHGFSKDENKDWTRIKQFFLKPVTIFFLNLLSYLIFLSLFSYLMVVSFNPTFSVIEIIICVWVFTLCVEEIRQCISSDSKGILKKLKLYLKDSWNKLDITTITLFLIGIILRLINNDQCFEAARVILCVDLVAFYVRLLHIFVVSSSLGPKLVMLRKMTMKDLISFMVIVLVFVLAYSVSTEALLYPNTELSVKLLYQLPRKAYWHIYGELFLDDIEGASSCTDNPEKYGTNNELRCPSTVGKYLAPIFLGIYMLFTNVILLNILIAMFSNTFNNIEQKSYSYWCLQRYHLIYEYHSRPFLPPPFIVFVHLYRVCIWLKSKNGTNGEQNIFKREIKPKPSRNIIRREKSKAKQCLNMHENERTKLQTSIQKVLESQTQLESRLETIENKLGQHLNERIN